MPLGASKASLLGAAGSGGVATMEVISRIVADGSSTVITFSSIPQTYGHLRLIMSKAKRSVQGSSFSLMVNNDNTQTDYGIWGASSAAGCGSSSWDSEGQAAANIFSSYGDVPTATDGTFATFDFPNYADSSIGTSAQSVIGGRIFGSGIGGIMGFAGFGYDDAAACTRLDFFYAYGTNSNYNYAAPTTFTLFGIGTAN